MLYDLLNCISLAQNILALVNYESWQPWTGQFRYACKVGNCAAQAVMHSHCMSHTSQRRLWLNMSKFFIQSLQNHSYWFSPIVSDMIVHNFHPSLFNGDLASPQARSPSHAPQWAVSLLDQDKFVGWLHRKWLCNKITYPLISLMKAQQEDANEQVAFTLHTDQSWCTAFTLYTCWNLQSNVCILSHSTPLWMIGRSHKCCERPQGGSLGRCI